MNFFHSAELPPTPTLPRGGREEYASATPSPGGEGRGGVKFNPMEASA